MRFSLVAALVSGCALSSSACLRFSATARPNHAPIAHVASSTLSVTAGDVVTLDGSTSSDPDGDKLTFAWAQVGAATVAITGASASKATFIAPNQAGHVAIGLTVSDGITTSEPAIVDVDVATIPPPPPDLVAQITGPSSGPPIVASTFVATPQPEGGLADSALSFHWAAIGPGCSGFVVECVRDADGDPAFGFTPPEEGAYDIRLTVSDGTRDSTPAHFAFSSTSGAPAVTVAQLAHGPFHAGDNVGVGVSAPDGNAFTFAWSQVSAPANADGSFTSTSTRNTVFHVVAHGTYTLAVDVTDTVTQEHTSATTAIVVDDTAPTVTLSNDTFSSAPGAPVTIAAAASDVDLGDAPTFAWTLVSSPSGSAAPTLAGANTATLTFTATTHTPVQDVSGCASDPSGCYELALVVSDGTLTATANAFVVVVDRAPVIIADTPVSTQTSTPTPLSASATDLDADLVAFSWRVTTTPPNGAACAASSNGSSACVAGDDSATPVFTAPDGGDGTYTLVVTASDGIASASTSVVVIVSPGAPPSNHAPIASITADATSIVSGGVVHLDGSASTDPDNDAIATFSWSVIDAPAGSASTFSPASADVAAPSLSLLGRGAYTVQLVVTDAHGLASTPATLRIGATNAAPIANAGSDVVVANHASVALSGSATDLDHDAIAFRWSVVDAPNGDVASGVLTNAGSADASFTPTLRSLVDDPALCGVHDCYVLALDAFDGIDHATDTVVVVSTNAAPIANAGVDQGNAGEHVALDGTASFDPDGDTLTSFVWTQIAGPDVTGGTGTFSGAIVSFTAPATTTYAFSLVVSDGTLTSSADDVVIVVPHIDRAPVVTAPNANVTAIAGATFALHVDVFDADADPTNVAWSLVSGDATRFSTSLAGTDPTLVAPALKALLAANDGDNGATYSVTATDPDGKTSLPIVVHVFVLPGAEHVVLSDHGVDSGTCGAVNDPCATLSRALSSASAEGKDVIAVNAGFSETTSASGVPWPANVSFVGGRDPITFARTSTPTTFSCAGTTDPDTACVLFTAGDDDTEHVDNFSIVADPGASSSTVALRCDQCATNFHDVTAAASGAPISIALLVDGGAGSPDATPTFENLTASVDDGCDLEAIVVDDASVVTATNVVASVGAIASGCATTTTDTLSVRGGFADFTNATLSHAGVNIDATGSARLTDSLVVVDAGDGINVVDGSAILEHSVVASTAGDVGSVGLRFGAQPNAPGASVDLSAITGFASSTDLADNGANASFTQSFAALPATCDALTATTATDLDPNSAFATNCQASGLVEALGRTCAFAADFTIVDETCLN